MNERDMSPEEREQLDGEQLQRDSLTDDAAGPTSEPDVRTRFEEGPDTASAQSTGITGGR